MTTHAMSFDTDATAVTGTVAVGVDGTDTALGALEWAAGRARRDGAPLTIVGVHGHVAVADATAPLSAQMVQAAVDAAYERVDEAVADAQQRHPDLDIRGVVLHDDPISALADVSGRARLLVIGSRGLGGPTARLRGGVADRVLADLRGPVVVVPDGSVSPTHDGPGVVVLGIDDTYVSHSAAVVAAEEARAGSGRLIAVNVWEYGVLWGAHPMDRDAALAAEELGRRHDAVTDDLREVMHDVDLEVRIERGDVPRVLTRVSEEADLVVVGTRGRGNLNGMMFGSTSRQLAQDSTCPVLIVPAPDDGEDDAVEGGWEPERLPRT